MRLSIVIHLQEDSKAGLTLDPRLAGGMLVGKDGERRRISTCSGYSTGPGGLLLIWYFAFLISDGSRQGSNSPRRISGASSASGYYSDDRERASFDSTAHGSMKSQHWRYSFRRYEEEQRDSREDESRGVRNSPSYQSNIRVSVSSSSPGSQWPGSSPNQWRKESVTIIESQEPMEDDNEEENQADVDTDTEQVVAAGQKEALRSSRLSSSVDSCQEGHFLSVPQQPITASSSAETLTDNTITAPGTPTLQPTTPTIPPYHKEIRSRFSSDTSDPDVEPQGEERRLNASPMPQQPIPVPFEIPPREPTVPRILTDSSSGSPPPILKGRSPAPSRKSSEVSFPGLPSNVDSPASSRKRTQSCTLAPVAQYANYNSYNMDEDDADHMVYLESSRVSRSSPNTRETSFSGMCHTIFFFFFSSEKRVKWFISLSFFRDEQDLCQLHPSPA